MVPAVQTLHKRLRDCVECMGVGVSMQRNDHVAEEGNAALPQGTTVIKDLGDVRCCSSRCAEHTFREIHPSHLLHRGNKTGPFMCVSFA